MIASTATTTRSSRASSPLGRVFRALPVFGQVIRDVERGVYSIFCVLVILLTPLVLAIQIWGLAALVIAAISFVPLMSALLIWVTLPWAAH